MEKNIRKIILEALGVPDFILDAAEIVYIEFMSNLKSIKKIKEKRFEFTKNVDFKISDMNVDELKLIIEFHQYDVDEVALISMGSAIKTKVEDLRLKSIMDEGKVILKTDFAYDVDSEIEDVIDLCVRDKDNIVSTLAHELKHSYFNFKKPTESIARRAHYGAYTSLSFPIKEVRDFMFFVYFTTFAENIVRPTEVASLMKSKGIKKEEFMNFLFDNDTYKTLKRIHNWSFEGFKKDLLNNMDEVNKFLEMVDTDFDELSTDESRVNEVLRLVFVNIGNRFGQQALQYLANSPIEIIFGLSKEKEEYFEKIVDTFRKFDNNINGFYNYNEKMFKTVSKDIMKKLSKLYAMITSDTQSIKNWDLHHKVNKTNTNIQKESLYKRKKK